MKLIRRRVLGATIGLAVFGSSAGAALGSLPFGISAKSLVPKADLNQRVHLENDGVEFKTKAPTDVAIQTVTFQPGGRTGWHHHPGFVLVTVQAGEVTVFDADCRTETYGPGTPNGAAFTESGDDPLEVRNTGSVEATVYAALVAPDANPPVFRVEDNVVTCPTIPESE